MEETKCKQFCWTPCIIANPPIPYDLRRQVVVVVVVDAFHQEKALVGAFSVILQLHQLIDLRHYTRLHLSSFVLL